MHPPPALNLLDKKRDKNKCDMLDEKNRLTSEKEVKEETRKRTLLELSANYRAAENGTSSKLSVSMSSLQSVSTSIVGSANKTSPMVLDRFRSEMALSKTEEEEDDAKSDSDSHPSEKLVKEKKINPECDNRIIGYLTGKMVPKKKSSESHEVQYTNNKVQWKQEIDKKYTCTIGESVIESKFGGLYHTTSYSISSSRNMAEVKRRFKHFHWLHEQLSAKYIFIPIPPLPEKQVAGRYQEDIIKHRKHILQLWVDKICQHPVLSQSEVWLHFISCTDEKDWKNGKRRAEKDEYVGAWFLNSISVPEEPFDNNISLQLEGLKKGVKMSEEALHLTCVSLEQCEHVNSSSVKGAFQKLSKTLNRYQTQLKFEDCPGAATLSTAFAETASKFYDIGGAYGSVQDSDIESSIDLFHSLDFRQEEISDILGLHERALQKFQESVKGLSSVEAEKMKQRIDAMSYAVLAEVQHQTAEKVEDLKSTMGTYLKRQAAFYQDVASKLASLSAKYD